MQDGEGKHMTTPAGRRWIVLSGLVLLASVLLVAYFRKVQIEVEAGASVLALVTAGAVLIERVIELAWTATGSRLGTRWPLRPISDQLTAFATQVNEPLEKLVPQVEGLVDSGKEAFEEVPDALKKAKRYREELVKSVDDLVLLGPENPAAREAAAAASLAVVGLRKLAKNKGDIEKAANGAEEALEKVSGFLKTFEDNPGRRVISLYVGGCAGLVVATAFGLDAIQAVFGGVPEDPIADQLYGWLPGIGAAATGLVMGAGAAPAHEAIKALQESKKRSKRE